eukprot:gene10296-biopygen10653
MRRSDESRVNTLFVASICVSRRCAHQAQGAPAVRNPASIRGPSNAALNTRSNAAFSARIDAASSPHMFDAVFSEFSMMNATISVCIMVGIAFSARSINAEGSSTQHSVRAASTQKVHHCGGDTRLGRGAHAPLCRAAAVRVVGRGLAAGTRFGSPLMNLVVR